MGNQNLTDDSLSYFWQVGYGTVTSQAMMKYSLPGGGGLLIATLVANSPQVLLIFLISPTMNYLPACSLRMNGQNTPTASILYALQA